MKDRSRDLLPDEWYTARGESSHRLATVALVRLVSESRLGIRRQISDDFYAEGNLSAIHYKADVSSSDFGKLVSGIDAWGFGYRAGVARHIYSDSEAEYTARAWLDGKTINWTDFTDAGHSELSLEDGHEAFIGAGLSVKAVRHVGSSGQAVTMHAFGDVELPINGSTTVNLSGERFLSEAPDTRVRLGLGAEWRRNEMDFNAAIEVSGVDARDNAFQFGVLKKF